MSKPEKPTTPRTAKVTKIGSSGKKQLSLMSFFKPAKEKDPKEPKEVNEVKEVKQSKELKEKETPKESEISSKPTAKSGPASSPLKAQVDYDDDSEKENSMIGKYTDTPLTSESDVSHLNIKSIPKSSPIKASSSKRRTKPALSYAESDSEDEVKTSVRKKRKILDSDDEDVFQPDESEDDDDKMSDFIVEDEDESAMEQDDEDEEEEVTIKKKSKQKATPVKTESSPPKRETPLGNKFVASSNYTSKVTPKPVKTEKASPKPKNFAKENEERYQWLVNIRDASKRPIDDPEYDPRTLFIPSAAWAKFTAFEKQYWEIKSKMWDTVVFFKKGKFYELYENDAMIANTEFDLKIAGGGRANMKLAGIPEMSFEYWAKEFISHGYKIAKVDQKETLLAKEMRGGSTKEEKIIKRELTAVLTGGTLTDLDMISDDMAIYCLAIKEESTEDGKVFGVAFVDTATSELNLVELHDDQECTKLDTLIAQIKPKEILCEKNNLCPTAVKILKFNGNPIWNSLNPYSEFWDYDTTVENMKSSTYYETSEYPPILNEFQESHKVAFSAFGGLLFYLKSLKLDENVMTLKNFKLYDISKHSSGRMLLDGVTLTNLEILNNSNGGDQGTLLKLVNRAITPFGKRVLKNWILHPLTNPSDINARYDTVDFLMNDNPEFRMSLESLLNGIPDLERLLARIHSKTLKFKEFLRVVESFERIIKSIKELQEHDLGNAGVLVDYIKSFPPELTSFIGEWEDAFDRSQAVNDIVAPTQGIDQEFDDSLAKMNDLEGQLNEHLSAYKKQFKSHEMCFRDSGKEIFLIEVPVKIKSIPKDWQQMGSTSKVKRYWSPEVRVLVRELLEQRELHKMVCETLRARMYERFDKHYSAWMAAVKSIAKIDCLIALTKSSETIGYPSCRPNFVESDQGLLEFNELRHPCFVGTKEFIPNDVVLGGDKPGFGLLTGANAAGKSTLMRTTAMAVILSQIGCYITASLAKLSPIDKIMTRLGANDNIMQGKSTFFVELSETKKILSNATSKSLVILDELGRGGSSSDGYAIAESVLHHMSTHVQPLGFFATHYGSLGLSFTEHPQIRPLRMGIIADESSRNITFLYKLEEGSASGSFGMNVAAMCGIAHDIVDNAEVAAKDYEQTSQLKKHHDSQTNRLCLGLQSDFKWLVQDYQELSKDILRYDEPIRQAALNNIFEMIKE